MTPLQVELIQLYGLSRREAEIVERTSVGALNREIGFALRISESTVKGHLHNAFLKLKVRRRAEIMIRFLGRSGGLYASQG